MCLSVPLLTLSFFLGAAVTQCYFPCRDRCRLFRARHSLGVRYRLCVCWVESVSPSSFPPSSSFQILVRCHFAVPSFLFRWWMFIPLLLSFFAVANFFFFFFGDVTDGHHVHSRISSSTFSPLLSGCPSLQLPFFFSAPVVF